MRAALIWGLLTAGMLVPVLIALANPLQQSRDVPWIVGGMAGVAALALLLAQPLLAAGLLPAPSTRQARRWHRWLGATIAALVGIHVVGLYISSPEDIADVLMLAAPTPFSVYGVIGLAGMALTVLLVALRSRAGLRYAVWRIIHNALALVVVAATIAHALLIEGAMGAVSKAGLSVAVAVATIWALVRVHGGRRRLR